MANWNWRVTDEQEFNPDQKTPNYPEHQGNWALLVAGSDEWKDYRHQADVLDMYQFLKSQGYDDEHIVLIMEDNLAYHNRNLHQGVIRNRIDGKNLYTDVQVDYRLSQLSTHDLESIICGEASEEFPQVIGAGPNDNVLIFWSGHGDRDVMYFGEQPFKAWEVRKTFDRMNTGNKYRKCLCLFESCYSGSVAEACEGIPGLLFITAANAYEPSKADVSDPEMGIWLSNRFTRTLVDQLREKPKTSMRDLYLKLSRNTTGSHATVYNDTYFGNLYLSTLEEFTVPLATTSMQ